MSETCGAAHREIRRPLRRTSSEERETVENQGLRAERALGAGIAARLAVHRTGQDSARNQRRREIRKLFPARSQRGKAATKEVLEKTAFIPDNG
jgi:hypothetical protein